MKRIKIVSVIISIMLMVLALPMGITAAAATSSWDGTTITQPTSMKTIEGVYYYEISTAEELAYIAKTGGDWLGYNYILANDITLNSVELTYDANGNLTVNASILNQWTPINGFTGIFDGAGHSISGVYVNTTSSAGFFANCRGDVSNLTITNSYIKGGSGVGGICGSFNETGKDMKNCYFDGAVVGTSSVGGLIGSNDCTNVSNSGNYGDVWGNGSHVAGIVGRFDAYGIDNCFNEGNIYSTGDYVAGIAGSSRTYGISGCKNSGNITGNNYVGGICGKIENAGLSSCGNTGNISGTQYVGGICGYSAYYYVESWMGSISNGYNTGNVEGESYVGGITGYVNYANISNCYNIGNVIGASATGAVIGHSETIWGKGSVSGCYYLKTDTINTAIVGFGNSGDVEGIVRNKKAGFFPIVADSSADPSYSKLGYKNGETDDPIENDTPNANEPEKEIVWDGTILKPSIMITENGVNYYKIFTGKELAYIAQTGGEWLGYNYILANDIVLNDVALTYDTNGNLTADVSALNQWTPINGFRGIFDGAGHSISGIYVNTTSSAGFFANCRGDVSNLTITNSYIKGGSGVGGICGSFNETGKDMKNCYFDGAVVGTSSVGGLIGSNDCTNVSNSGNYGDVWGNGSHVAGIVGRFDAYGIDNCFNEGNIYSTGDYVAGIAGSSRTYGISGCKNSGNITGNNYVGGICGKIENAGLSSCGNTGNISGTQYVGGICGYSAYYYVESWMGSISNGYNTGNVEGESYVGGITGYVNYANVSNCLNAGNVTGSSTTGAIVGHSESIWGKGSVSGCYYLKSAIINANLLALGNATEDTDGATSKDDSFFCINSDKTLNKNGHTYSSTVLCDATCDNCGYERTVTHTYDNVKYDSDKHWYECDCGEKKADSEASHTGGTATCISKAKCTVCKQSYGSLSEHNFNENAWGYKKTDGHAHACQTSGCSEHDTVIVHTSSGAATEDVAETCTECGYIISPALGHKKHTAKTEWITDDKYHWHECTGCEEQQLDKSSHKDLDNNASCDTCGAAVPVGTTGESDNANTELPDGSDQNNTGTDSGKTNGCGGIIGGASVIVITLAGAGAFFVFRKKKSR